jgi:hypothetical protein
MNNQAENVKYDTYSSYKNFDGVEVMWPIEIAEDIMKVIIDFVKRNIRLQEINSSVNI